MASTLIVYGSAYGQTRKIVERVAARLHEAGIESTIVKGDALPPGLRPGDYDGVIVAGSVLFGKHQKYLETFVLQHLELLNRRPSMFLSVCGAASRDTPEGETLASKYRIAFLKRTTWAPRLAHSLGGAVPYTRYPFFTRLMLRLINASTGGPVDTSRDWEFTDWEVVDRLAREFLLVLDGKVPLAVTV